MMTCVGCVLRILLSVVVGVAALAFLPGIGPNIKYESYTVNRAPRFEGRYARNSKLNAAECILKYEVDGPEAPVVRGDDIYTGLTDGRIVKVTFDGKLETVVRLAPADGTPTRPLGMRFAQDGSLLVADPFRGVFRVNVTARTVETVTKAPNAFVTNDLDVGSDGAIYWSASTTKYGMDDIFPFEVLGEPSGALLKYDPKTRQSTALVEKIHFANGVQLSPSQDFVLVSEFMRYRVLRHYIKGPKKGQTDVFVDNLPGTPDNIRSNDRGGFYVSLFMTRHEDALSPIDYLADQPLARKVVNRAAYLFGYTWNLLTQVLPSNLVEVIRSTAVGPSWSLFEPDVAMIVELDVDGNVIDTLQNTDGRVRSVSQVALHPKYYVIASALKSCIYKMKRT